MIDLAGRKYRVYYNNSSCKVYNGDHIYALNMCSTRIPTRIPIEEGGSISLPNGDTLFINEKYGVLHDSPEYKGIDLSLASGHEFIIWYYMVKLDIWQESGYGCVYDFDENAMYAEGNYMRIYYDLNGGIVYDQPYYDLSQSERFAFDNHVPFITLVIHDDKWVLVDNNPLYEGNKVTLNSKERIWISNRWGSQDDGSMICFSRESGRSCFAYLKYRNNVVNQTDRFWLGLDCYLDNDTSITIYDYGDEDDYMSAINHSDDYSEENVSHYLNRLCVIRYNSSASSWYVEEDNS